MKKMLSLVRLVHYDSAAHGACERRRDVDCEDSSLQRHFSYFGHDAFGSVGALQAERCAILDNSSRDLRVHSFAFGPEPNKTPEPTSTSVMPRAIVPFSDLKQRTDFQNHARAMPAVAVAHL